MKPALADRQTERSKPKTGARVLVRQHTLDKLRDAIIVGRYPPGARLVERELCEAMGVSRTSIREALRQLQSEHLVEVGPRRNIRVAVISARDAEDIYSLRETLESMAAGRFAASAPLGARGRLARSHADLRQAVAAGHTEKAARMAGTLNEIVLSGAGSRVISEIARQLLARVDYLRFRSMSAPRRLDEGLSEWNAIIAAIDAQDASGAEAAMLTHLRNSRAAVLAALTTLAPSPLTPPWRTQ